MKHFIFIALILICSCSDNSKNTKLSNEQKPIDSIVPTREYKVISDSTNVLEKRIQTIELQYTLWGCACPNWIKPSDAVKYQDSNFLKQHIFIEAADSSLFFPDGNLDIDKENILVTGQFYLREDYPKGTMEMEEALSKAKVFRYTKIKRVKK